MISEMLKEKRKQENLTQRELAKKIQVKQDKIAAYETGLYQPSGVNRLKVMRFLGYQDEIRKEISQQIIKFREIHNLSINKLAKLLEVSNTQLALWEDCKAMPSNKNYKKIVKLFEGDLNMKTKQRNNYPNALIRFREENSITVKELADMLEIAYPTMLDWLSGKHVPSDINKAKIKRLFKAYNFKMKRYAEIKQHEIVNKPRQQVMTVLSDNMTSLELLEQINHFRQLEGRAELLHKNLLAVIRDEFDDEISRLKIQPSDYISSRGKVYQMFNLTISQAKQVLVRESKQVRRAVIKYLEHLEQQLQQHTEPQKQPQTLEITNKTIIKYLINLDDRERTEVVNNIKNLDKILGE